MTRQVLNSVFFRPLVIDQFSNMSINIVHENFMRTTDVQSIFFKCNQYVKFVYKLHLKFFEANNNTHQSKVNTCPRYYIDNVSKYKIHVHELSNQEERRVCCEPFVPVSKRVPIRSQNKIPASSSSFRFLVIIGVNLFVSLFL